MKIWLFAKPDQFLFACQLKLTVSQESIRNVHPYKKNDQLTSLGMRFRTILRTWCINHAGNFILPCTTQLFYGGQPGVQCHTHIGVHGRETKAFSTPY